MDELFKAQLRLSLEVLSSVLTFLASPHLAETVRRLCQDREFYETVRRASRALQELETSCYGVPRVDLARRLVREVKACQDMECVRRVVEEYEEILGPAPSP